MLLPETRVNLQRPQRRDAANVVFHPRINNVDDAALLPCTGECVRRVICLPRPFRSFPSQETTISRILWRGTSNANAHPELVERARIGVGVDGPGIDAMNSTAGRPKKSHFNRPTNERVLIPFSSPDILLSSKSMGYLYAWQSSRLSAT